MTDVNYFRQAESMNIEENDLELVTRAKAGDREAFGALVRRYQNNMYNLALNLLGSRDEAEDVTAEAFVRAWQSIKGFRNDASFKTWLWQIVTNLSRNCLRRRYITRRIFFWQKHESDDDEEAPENKWEDHAAGGDPEQQADRQNVRHLIMKARKTLSRREQEVFALKYDENMKIAEIAGMLHLSENTVKVLLFRATRKLAVALKDYRR
jgi:RNA polymerase sigma-70 factor (ECF subfamily)